MTGHTFWKRVAAAATAAGLAVVLAACGSNGSGGSTTADGRTTLVWNMWSGSTAEVDAWNHLSQMVTAKYADTSLEFQTSSFSDYWTKLAAQASGGETGCILGVQSLRARSIAPLLVPLDDMLAGVGINGADFDQSIWKGLQVDGRQLAIPYDFGPLVMFYNADRFREAGVPVPSTSWTVQDFLSAAQSLTGGGKYGFALYPTIDSVIPWSLSLTGTDPVTPDGKLDLTQQGFVQAVQWYTDLVDKLHVAPQVAASSDPTPALSSFIAGDAAMVVDGPWQLVNVKKQAQFEVGVLPIPAGDTGSHSQVAGSGFGISQTCPDPEKALQAIAVLTGAGGAAVPRRAGPCLPGPHRPAGRLVPPGPRECQGGAEGGDRQQRHIARDGELHAGLAALHAVRRAGGERPAVGAGLPRRGAAADRMTQQQVGRHQDLSGRAAARGRGAPAGRRLHVTVSLPAPPAEVRRADAGRGVRRGDGRGALGFLAPSTTGFLLFTLIPLVGSLVISFFAWPVLGRKRFIGLDNFVELLSDPIFHRIMLNTLVFVVIYVPLNIVVSLGLALWISPRVRGRGLYRLLFFIPTVTPMIANALVWRLLYQPGGVFDQAFQAVLGVPAPNFLGDTRWAMAAVILMSVWQGFGYNMLVFSAGLDAIPQSIQEAAAIDGAGPLRRFWSITVPMLSPSMFFAMIMTLITSFQVFVQPYVLTRGGPGVATETMVLNLYRQGFEQFDLGTASTIGWFLFMIIMLVTALQFLGQKRWVHYDG